MREMPVSYRAIIVADLVLTQGSELYWEGREHGERRIEQGVALILLHLSGEGEVIMHEVSLVTSDGCHPRF
jgi:hypothetical protein